MQDEHNRSEIQQSSLQQQINLYRDIINNKNLQLKVASETQDPNRRRSSFSNKDLDFLIARGGSGSLDCDISNIEDGEIEYNINNDSHFHKFQLEHYQKIFRALASFEYI